MSTGNADPPGSQPSRNYALEHRKRKVDSGGTVLASQVLETTGPPVSLELQLVNDQEYSGEGNAVALVNCICRDAPGRMVPDAAPMLHFTVNGNATILGTGSDVCDRITKNNCRRPI